MEICSLATTTCPHRKRVFVECFALFSMASLMLSSCTSSRQIPSPQFEMGKRVYAQQCASCHGANGEGKYPSTWKQPDTSGLIDAPPHNADGHTWHHADGLLFDIIKNGLTVTGFHPMPAFKEKLTDEEIWAVIAFLKSWWKPDQVEIQATMSANYTPSAQ